MTLYIIKCLTTYTFEYDNDEDAIECYNNGLWDQSDMTEESTIQLMKITDNDEYTTIKED